ncbi:MAG: 3-keto-5-aminohexanoate cleavage protein [Alphaproteobacteria bacterium MedPE-SWcel]|nr:MAG: 3-keto-5-aminohexanoate cleavage protein [Alphaproteobacteria bacterium MedPE-SWcel]
MTDPQIMTDPYIMVAPTGARRRKSDHPALPVTMAEIIDTAAACHAAGAAGLHLHVRDGEGRHCLDAGRYAETLSELQLRVPQMRAQITTEAAGLFDVPAQLACLNALRPDWASISVREIARDPDLADRVYGLCAETGTEVQHILYDAEDAALLRAWQARGIVRQGQSSVLFVLGRYAVGQQSEPGQLTPMLSAHRGGGPWMLCAFGPQEHACLQAAAARGGDLRVGFENSLFAADGVMHADNAASVRTLIAEIDPIDPIDPIERTSP